MTRTLLIFDREKSYVKKLAEYINSKKDFPFRAVYCNERTELKEIVQRWDVELFLVEESFLKYVEEYAASDRVIPLWGYSRQTSNISGGIYKYQCGEDIIREILIKVAKIEGLGKLVSRKNKMQIIGFYSPVGRSLQTTLSLIMGKLIAKKSKVLYINLEGYSGLEELLQFTFSFDLSDLMYELSSNSSGLTAFIGANVRNIEGLDILPPMRNHKDLSSIDIDEWKQLLDIIEQNTEYEYIIMDMSESIRNLSDMLMLCGRIYMTVENDNLARAKLNQFFDTLEEEYSEELKGKIVKCEAKNIAELGDISIERVNGPLGDYCRKLMADGR